MLTRGEDLRTLAPYHMRSPPPKDARPVGFGEYMKHAASGSGIEATTPSIPLSRRSTIVGATPRRANSMAAVRPVGRTDDQDLHVSGVLHVM